MNDPDKGRADLSRARTDILEIFASALDGADSGKLVQSQIRLENDIFRVGGHTYRLAAHPRIYLFGIGKVAARMASPLEKLLGNRIAGGLVVVKDGYGAPLEKIEVREAGHPIPDARGVKAAEAMIEMIRVLRRDDLVLFIVAGGGSSLFVLPAGALTLDDKIQVNRVLLRCGAPIDEINAVRKHLSAVKGGRLIPMIYPATLVNLILSDVVGDRLQDIASGPTVPPARPGIDPLRIIERYGLAGEIPGAVLEHLKRRGKEPVEIPAPPGGLRDRITNVMVGNNRSLLESARRRAVELGYETRILTPLLEGEAREEAERLSRFAIDLKNERTSSAAPLCLLIGGETTVTLRGKGTGGRCMEFALSAAISLEGEDIVTLAAGSDGTDGPTDAAGAIVDGETCQKGREKDLDPGIALDANDSYTFFRSIGDLVVTGPTTTNVMDLYAFIIPRKDNRLAGEKSIEQT